LIASGRKTVTSPLIKFPVKSVVLIGATHVGKTCIVKRGTTGVFDCNTLPTLGASYTSKVVNVGSAVTRLLIWDTAGQERYRGITPMYYRNAVAAVIVYSIADQDSFTQVDEWLRSLEDNIPAGLLLFLVGNKSDLDDALRKVQIDEGREKANEIHADFTEVSAKNGEGINELFITIASSCLEHQKAAGKGDATNTPEVVEVGRTAHPAGEEGSCC
jgi:Ras-related protein Rab-5C